jgi:hypothetical protein
VDCLTPPRDEPALLVQLRVYRLVQQRPVLDLGAPAAVADLRERCYADTRTTYRADIRTTYSPVGNIGDSWCLKNERTNCGMRLIAAS